MQDNLIWIRFDESDRYLAAPNFCLSDSRVGQVCRDDFRGYCNLVLVFWHDSNCQACLSTVESFIEKAEDYKAANTCVLFIQENSVGEHQLPSKILNKGKGFLRVLLDAGGKTRKEYAQLVDESLVRENDVVVFILDMYGAPYYALSMDEIDHPAFHEEALRWLNFIGMLCPE
jgi:peroxiredoxin